jgi:hypothetical protein
MMIFRNTLILMSFAIVAIVSGCKTTDPVAPAGAMKQSPGTRAGDIYSCSDIIQAPTPTEEQPLAGRYVITVFGDAGTLTWMGKDGANDVHDAVCRFNENLNITTCETFADLIISSEPNTAPIWTFTVDHARENDVRLLGFNGKYAEFKASGKPMQFIGVIHQCADEAMR